MAPNWMRLRSSWTFWRSTSSASSLRQPALDLLGPHTENRQLCALWTTSSPHPIWPLMPWIWTFALMSLQRRRTSRSAFSGAQTRRPQISKQPRTPFSFVASGLVGGRRRLASLQPYCAQHDGRAWQRRRPLSPEPGALAARRPEAHDPRGQEATTTVAG